MNISGNKIQLFIVLALACFVQIFVFPTPVNAENQLIQDKMTTVKARVLEVISEEIKTVPGTDVVSKYQKIKVEILAGDEKGKIVTIMNDYLSLKADETFYLRTTVRGEDGLIQYTVSEPYRLPAVLFFIVLFVILVFIFGGMQGVRGLASLAGSLILILYVLLPGILLGYSPILVSLSVASLVIILGSYVTHGFNKTTTSAVIGMIITIIVTGILAYVAVHWARLSGFSNDEAIYLNLDTRGSIDFVGLLLGGMLIGFLGVLYDVAIGQAISVEELHRIAPHVPRVVIYKRTIRIGREHIGALVNTLVIAYVGVSLPLLLLYTKGVSEPLGMTLNREIFATEIIRTMIGSIGLVIAVPITTFISVLILMKKTAPVLGEISQEILDREKREIESLDHTGHNGHHQ